MTLRSVLLGIFNSSEHLLIIPDDKEQLVFGLEFPKLTGKFLEELPRHLVRIQFLIAREKKIVREHISKPTSPEIKEKIQVATSNIYTLNELFDLLNKDYKYNSSSVRTQNGCRTVIQYDEARNCLVYAALSPIR